jgi:hypothetical protein
MTGARRVGGHGQTVVAVLAPRRRGVVSAVEAERSHRGACTHLTSHGWQRARVHVSRRATTRVIGSAWCRGLYQGHMRE